MRVAVTIFLCACYMLNSPILKLYFPDIGKDWHQYAEFWLTRAKVYECMFFLFFWLLYTEYKGMVKSLATFGMIMTAGSVVDKLLFSFTNYLYSDYILIVVAIILSIRVYVREIR